MMWIFEYIGRKSNGFFKNNIQLKSDQVHNEMNPVKNNRKLPFGKDDFGSIPSMIIRILKGIWITFITNQSSMGIRLDVVKFPQIRQRGGYDIDWIGGDEGKVRSCDWE